MNTVLILVSHGTLAEGVYSAAAMMLGETDGIRCFCLTDKDDSVSFRHKVREGIQDPADSGVLLLCDLLGGSPMTMALDELVLHTVMRNNPQSEPSKTTVKLSYSTRKPLSKLKFTQSSVT